jgi:DNA-binding response OmpR family regulator
MSDDTPKQSVLIIEDDDSIAGAVEILVRKQGLEPLRAATGRQGLRLFYNLQPDLVVLDVGLPELDGWQVLERIREVSEVPILMLTAKALESDKVHGLRSGADDYLTKPFSTRELGARIEALLRRAATARPDQPESTDVFVDGSTTIDLVAREASVDGVPVALSALEFRLLEAFVRHPGQALSHEQLLELAWDDPYGIGPDRVKFTVLRLRRKLGWTEGRTGPLEAVRGYGYRYRASRP